jgi:hypothetical protein
MALDGQQPFPWDYFRVARDPGTTSATTIYFSFMEDS